MSARWFRFYDEALNDPKVQMLPLDLFKAWVNILCLASKGGGILPQLADIAFALRVNIDVAQDYLTRLVGAGLLDGDADELRPHNWNKRQFVSDNSTGRVQKHRNKTETVSCNDDETFQKRPQIQIQITEAETDKKESRAVRKRTRTGYSDDFESFWREYPSRGKAQNPKQPASVAFARLVAQGAEPESLISAAKAEARLQREAGKAGTEFVPMAVTWLRQCRYEHFAQPPPAANVVRFEPPPGAPSEDELRAKYARRNREGDSEDQERQSPPVVHGSGESGRGDGAEEWRGVAGREGRKPGARSMGAVLREIGMDASHLSHGHAEPGSGADCPDPLAGVV